MRKKHVELHHKDSIIKIQTVEILHIEFSRFFFFKEIHYKEMKRKKNREILKRLKSMSNFLKCKLN